MPAENSSPSLAQIRAELAALQDEARIYETDQLRRFMVQQLPAFLDEVARVVAAIQQAQLNPLNGPVRGWRTVDAAARVISQ